MGSVFSISCILIACLVRTVYMHQGMRYDIVCMNTAVAPGMYEKPEFISFDTKQQIIVLGRPLPFALLCCLAAVAATL